jgi:hypothetical protein
MRRKMILLLELRRHVIGVRFGIAASPVPTT